MITAPDIIPVPILSWSSEIEKVWLEFYSKPDDRNHRIEESIWRRSQLEINRLDSLWQNCGDQRRRILHYVHEFDRVDTANGTYVALVGTYLYYSVMLPDAEADATRRAILSALEGGAWIRSGHALAPAKWESGSLRVDLKEYVDHPEDPFESKNGYRNIDVVVQGGIVPTTDRSLPWKVYRSGVREKGRRGSPTEIPNLSILAEMSPFHIEVGSGMSIEAGVPALKHLHRTYGVEELVTGRFVFGEDDSGVLPKLFRHPSRELRSYGELFSAAIVAQPTPGHRALKSLLEKGLALGPAFTNNFDGLLKRAGFQEHYLRRYDELYPTIEFHPEAKALLVIGVHADRRKVQKQARERGLRVVYLDPEGYEVGGTYVSYPIEDAQTGDLLCRSPATPALVALDRQTGPP